MSCWTDGKLYKLVQLYSKFSNLWDRKHECYDDLRSRYTSYSKILESLSIPMCISISDVICKLKELRNIYVYELQKIEVASKAGCIYRPNHTWFGIMNEFLYDHLDADEKLAELSSSEEDTVSSEEILKVCHTRDRCFDSNSFSDSDSDCSFEVWNETSLRSLHRRCKPPKRSQAYFLRSPTVLRSTRMNTKYEYPKRTRASSRHVKNFSSKTTSRILSAAEDTQQCTRLDVKLTSSDVSIKYLRTEMVNGDEKRYKKNMKGPRCSTSKPPRFKNIKMIVSKSGYVVAKLRGSSNEIENEDCEFWEMMSMLGLGVPCPLTKLVTTCSPDTSCTSIDSSVNRNDHLLSRGSGTTCCTSSCKDISYENRVEKIIESVEATERKSKSSKDQFRSSQSCCSEVKTFTACKDMRNRKETFLEPCAKEMKVICLGDGTSLDNNFLELLQDLSIKICPIDAQCASGNCSSKQPNDVFENVLSCSTCSLITRPVKKFEMDATGSSVTKNVDPRPPNHETRSMTDKNIDEEKRSPNTDDATKSEEMSADLLDGVESAMEPTNDLGGTERKMEVNDKTKDINSTLSSTANRRKTGSPVPSGQKNYDVRVLLESADSRSSSGRNAILYEAKKELWEAGKLYNGGKYITHDIVEPSSKNEESLNFDIFGSQIAASLKMMGKHRAIKLKEIITEALRNEKRKTFS